jgi:putative DNA primase/helicase
MTTSKTVKSKAKPATSTAKPAKTRKAAAAEPVADAPAEQPPVPPPVDYTAAVEARVAEEAALLGNPLAHPLLKAGAKAAVQRFGAYIVKNTGVFFLHQQDGKDGEEPVVKEIFVCSWLLPVALVRDAKQEGWGMLVQFRDHDNHLHTWIMPMKLLKAGAEDIRASLLDMGLTIATSYKAKALLMDFILEANRKLQKDPKARARTTAQTGWLQLPSNKMVYVTPDSCIGNSSEQVHYVGDDNHRFSSCGTLDDWTIKVSMLIRGNSRPVFAVSIAFASALLHLMQMENCGLNLVGDSSIGKSTVLFVVASLFGHPENVVNAWNATHNGLEASAVLSNDACIILDELKQLPPETAGQTAYHLLNGKGRSRATLTGGSKGVKVWRLNVVSSGEIGLADISNAKGARTYAGQEQRLADIPADAGKGLGIFDTLNNQPSPDYLAQEAKEFSHRHYGTAFTTFVEKIAADPEAAKEQAKKLMAEFAAANRPKDAASQALRMLNRFALAAAAGELATIWGITGWNKGDSFWAASVCFKAWIAHRGGAGQQEPQELLKQVHSFFEAHGDSRFKRFYQGKLVEDKVIDMYGYRLDEVITTDCIDERHTEYYVLPNSFARIVQGFDPRVAARILAEKGLLYKGKPQSTPQKLPGMKVAKYYRINLDAAGNEEEL